MKIMTLNVWQGRLERVLLKHLETLGVDLACMQEAVQYDGRSGGLVSSYQTVQKSLKADHAFFSPLNSLALGSRELVNGNVIYSKFPFAKTETTFTRGEFKADFDFDADDYNIRAFQHCVVPVKGKQLHVLNHHGHHIDAHKNGDDETERQVKIVLDYISQLDGPVIMCGDFNLAPESQSIQLISRQLRNLPVENGLKTTRSKLTYKNEVCDYIFVSDDIQVNDFHMIDETISDHNALVLDFDVK